MTWPTDIIQAKRSQWLLRRWCHNATFNGYSIQMNCFSSHLNRKCQSYIEFSGACLWCDFLLIFGFSVSFALFLFVLVFAPSMFTCSSYPKRFETNTMNTSIKGSRSLLWIRYAIGLVWIWMDVEWVDESASFPIQLCSYCHVCLFFVVIKSKFSTFIHTERERDIHVNIQTCS